MNSRTGCESKIFNWNSKTVTKSSCHQVAYKLTISNKINTKLFYWCESSLHLLKIFPALMSGKICQMENETRTRLSLIFLFFLFTFFFIPRSEFFLINICPSSCHYQQHFLRCCFRQYHHPVTCCTIRTWSVKTKVPVTVSFRTDVCVDVVPADVS